jgi:hypothetical protein
MKHKRNISANGKLILIAVANAEPLGLFYSDLAEKTGASRHTLKLLTGRLVRQGLLERHKIGGNNSYFTTPGKFDLSQPITIRQAQLHRMADKVDGPPPTEAQIALVGAAERLEAAQYAFDEANYDLEQARKRVEAEKQGVAL